MDLDQPENEEEASQQQLHLILEGQGLVCVGGWFGSTNPRVIITAKRGKKGAWEKIYTSEIISNIGEGSQPRWKEIILSMQELCEGDSSKPIRIALESITGDTKTTLTTTKMGFLDTTVRDLLLVSGDDSKAATLHDEAKETSFGSLIVRHARIQKQSSRLNASFRKSIRSNMSWSVKSSSHRRPSLARNTTITTTTSTTPSTTRIPEDLLLEESSVLKLTLEADLVHASTGSSNNGLTTLMESVVGDMPGEFSLADNFSLAGVESLWGGTSTIANNPHANDDTEADDDWLKATTAHLGNFLGTTNPYFQVSSLTATTTTTATSSTNNVNDDEGSIWSLSSTPTTSGPYWQQQVYRSEPILDSVNPIWKPATIPLLLLCGGDLERPFRISIYSQRQDILAGNSAKPTHMGSFDATVVQLLHAARATARGDTHRLFVLNHKDNKKFGTVRVLEASLPEELDVSIGSDDEDDLMMMWGNESISEVTSGELGALLGQSSAIGGKTGQATKEKQKLAERKSLREKHNHKHHNHNNSSSEAAMETGHNSIASLHSGKYAAPRPSNFQQIHKRLSPETRGSIASRQSGSSQQEELKDVSENSTSVVRAKPEEEDDEKEAPDDESLHSLFRMAMGKTVADKSTGDMSKPSARPSLLMNPLGYATEMMEEANPMSFATGMMEAMATSMHMNAFLPATTEAPKEHDKKTSPIDEKPSKELPLEISVPSKREERSSSSDALSRIERAPRNRTDKPRLYLTLTGKNLTSVGKPFFQILACEGSTSGSASISWQQVYQSDEFPNSSNPTWNEAAVLIDRLCQGDLDRPIRFSIYKSGERKLPIGFFSTSVAEILAFDSDNPQSFSVGNGSISVHNAEVFPPFHAQTNDNDSALSSMAMHKTSDAAQASSTARSSNAIQAETRQSNFQFEKKEESLPSTRLSDIGAIFKAPHDEPGKDLVPAALATASGHKSGHTDDETHSLADLQIRVSETFSAMSVLTDMHESDFEADQKNEHKPGVPDLMPMRSSAKLVGDRLAKELGDIKESSSALNPYSVDGTTAEEQGVQRHSLTARSKSMNWKESPVGVTEVQNSDVRRPSRGTESDLLQDFLDTLEMLESDDKVDKVHTAKAPFRRAYTTVPTVKATLQRTSTTEGRLQQRKGGNPSVSARRMSQQTIDSPVLHLKSDQWDLKSESRTLLAKEQNERTSRDGANEQDLASTFNQGLLDEIAQLQAKLQEKDQLLVIARDDADKFESKSRDLEARIAHRNSSYQEVETALLEAKANLASEEAALAASKVATKSMEELKHANDRKMAALAAENEGYIEELIKFKKVAEDATEKLSASEAIIARYEEEKRDHLKQEEMWKDERTRASEKVAKLEMSIDTSHGRIEELKKQLEGVGREKSALETARDAAKREGDATTEGLRHQLAETTSTVDEVRTQVEELHREKLLLESTIEEARRESNATIEMLRRELALATERANADSVSGERHNQERVDFRDQTQEARLAEKSTLARRELESMLIDSENQVQAGREQTQADSVMIDTLSNQIDSLNKELETLREQAGQTTPPSTSEAKVLVFLREENSNLQKSLVETRAAARLHEQELANAQKKELMLSESVKARDRMVEKAQEELIALRKEKEDYLLEKSEWEQKLMEANTRVSENINQALKATLTQAGEKVKMYEEKSAVDDSKISELSSQNSLLKERMVKLEKLIEERAQSLLRYGTALQSKDSFIEELQRETNSLREKLAESVGEKETLMSACRVMELELKRLQETSEAAASQEEELKSLREKIPLLERQAREQSEGHQKVSQLEESLQNKESELQRQRDMIEALKRSRRTSSFDGTADKEQLSKVEQERDQAVKASKKLEKRVSALQKDLEGAHFAKGIYEGYWKDANTRIEQLKEIAEEGPETEASSRRKSLRKTMKSTRSIKSIKSSRSEKSVRSETKKPRKSTKISSALSKAYLTDSTAEEDEKEKPSSMLGLVVSAMEAKTGDDKALSQRSSSRSKEEHREARKSRTLAADRRKYRESVREKRESIRAKVKDVDKGESSKPRRGLEGRSKSRRDTKAAKSEGEEVSRVKPRKSSLQRSLAASKDTKASSSSAEREAKRKSEIGTLKEASSTYPGESKSSRRGKREVGGEEDDLDLR